MHSTQLLMTPPGRTRGRCIPRVPSATQSPFLPPLSLPLPFPFGPGCGLPLGAPPFPLDGAGVYLSKPVSAHSSSRARSGPASAAPWLQHKFAQQSRTQFRLPRHRLPRLQRSRRRPRIRRSRSRTCRRQQARLPILQRTMTAERRLVRRELAIRRQRCRCGTRARLPEPASVIMQLPRSPLRARVPCNPFHGHVERELNRSTGAPTTRPSR